VTVRQRDVVVVVPSHLDVDWSLFRDVPEKIPFIIVDDSDGGLAPPERDNVVIYSRSDQQALLGEHAEGMPRRSSACRNVGHLIAYREGFDVVVALDHDCRPAPGWWERHASALGEIEAVPAVSAEWVNTIDGTGHYARGFPYEMRDPDLPTTRSTVSGTGKLNVGLWSGVLDLNGVDKLAVDPPTEPGAGGESITAALGNLPVCGMNTAIARDVIPAFFFLPDVFLRGWQISRHDDIWGGYIAKKLMDLRGDLVTFGAPVVEHTKQTNLERVVYLEHYLHLLAPHFYQLVDEAVARVPADDYVTMFAAFCSEFESELGKATLPRAYRPVFVELLTAMRRWSACFRGPAQ